MLKKVSLKRGNSQLKKSSIKKSNSPIGERSKLKKSFLKKSREKTEKELYEEKLLRDKRTVFYKECEEKVGIRSAITGKKFYEPNRCNYHHTKSKENHPELAYCFLLILPCTLNEHSRCESDPSFYKENVDKIKFADENHDLCKQLSSEWEKNFESNYEKNKEL